MKAANYLRNPECMFVATNEDETCPGPKPEVIIPDAGMLFELKTKVTVNFEKMNFYSKKI